MSLLCPCRHRSAQSANTLITDSLGGSDLQSATDACLNFDGTGYLSAVSQTTVKSISVRVKVSNLKYQGLPIFGNAADTPWTVFLASTGVFISTTPDGTTYPYPSSIKIEDGLFHTVSLQGSELYIDRVLVSDQVTNNLMQSSNIFFGWYPGRFTGVGVGGTFQLKAASLYSTDSITQGSSTGLIGTVTISSNALLPSGDVTWKQSCDTTMLMCTDPAPVIKCVNSGTAGYMSAKSPVPINSISVLIKVKDSIDYGVPIFGNYWYTDKYWAVFLKPNGVYIAKYVGMHYKYPPSVNPQDGKFHLLTLQGPNLYIDGKLVAGGVANFLNKGDSVYFGWYPDHFHKVSMGGTVEFKEISLYSTDTIVPGSNAGLIDTLTFSPSGDLIPLRNKATWSRGGTFTLQDCTA